MKRMTPDDGLGRTVISPGARVAEVPRKATPLSPRDSRRRGQPRRFTHVFNSAGQKVPLDLPDETGHDDDAA